MKRYVIEDKNGKVLYTTKRFHDIAKLIHLGEEKIRRMIRNPIEGDPYRIYIDDQLIPDTLWLVVTHDKYEFPIAIFDSGQEMCRELHLSDAAVYSAINHAEARKCFCKYRKVYIGDLNDE